MNIAFLGLLAFVVVDMVRRWRSLGDRTVTRADWIVGRRAAVLGFFPAAVAVHEFGHVLAGRLEDLPLKRINLGLLGGRTVFASTPSSAAAAWVVTVGGPLAVALVSVAAMGLGAMRWRSKPFARQLLIVGGLTQFLAQLVVGPLVAPWTGGDWRDIYDFATTPRLSTLALCLHFAAVGGVLWWWVRSLRWTLRSLRSGTAVERRQLGLAVRRDPRDEEARRRLCRLDLEIGDLRAVEGLLFAKSDPSAEDEACRAQLAARRREWQVALDASEQGIAFAETGTPVEQSLWSVRAWALFNVGQPDQAVHAFAHIQPPRSEEGWVLYWRGLARLDAGDPVGGRSDVERALHQLPRRSAWRTYAERRLAGYPAPWRRRLLGLSMYLTRTVPAEAAAPSAEAV